VKNKYPTTSLPEEISEPTISVYPNPASSNQILTIEVNAPAKLQLFTVLGQAIGQPVQLQPSQPFSPTITQLKGVYMLRFSVQGKTYSRKIVIR
jgi:hypothetical protein